jgi:hypothetical protein
MNCGGSLVYFAPMAPSSGSGVSVGDAEAAGAGPDGVNRSDAVVTDPDEPPRSGAGRPAWWLAVALWVLIAIPFVVALVSLARPRWFPVLDLAQTELRIRDVASSHPPLIGLPGRIGNLVVQGSHPGPLSFWALWPFYKLFGGTSWAIQAATTSLNLIAVGLVLWMARRRAGTGLLLAVGAVVAVLMRFYGPELLTQAWNPYLPLAWWLVFLVAVWSILCDDFAMLPVGVFAANFCIQTHISYVGLVLGLGAVAAVSVLRTGYLQRNDPQTKRRIIRWTLVGVGMLLVFWIPALVQQLTNSPGNLDIIWNHFTQPPETPIGLGEGLRIFLIHLNPWRLIAQQDGMQGSGVPGALFVVVWAGSAAIAWRIRELVLVRLDVMLAATLLLSLSSMSRIFGYLWYYLVLWSWATTSLMLLAVGWTVVAVVARRVDAGDRERLSRLGAVALGAVIVLAVVAFAADSAVVESPDPRVSEVLGELVRPTVRALDDGTVPGGGPNGRYQVTWVDTVNIGGPGYGLLNELERSGFDVGLPDVYGAIVTSDRVMDAKDSTAVVHLSVGQRDIDLWRAKPGVVEVAAVDPRNARQQAEYQRLRKKVKRELAAAGLPDLVQAVDDNLFMATFQPQVPEEIQPSLIRMINLGQPSAIFVGPPDYTPPVRT